MGGRTHQKGLRLHFLRHHARRPRQGRADEGGLLPGQVPHLPQAAQLPIQQSALPLQQLHQLPGTPPVQIGPDLGEGHVQLPQGLDDMEDLQLLGRVIAVAVLTHPGR